MSLVYDIQLRLPDFSVVEHTDLETPFFEFTWLEPGTTYDWRVRARLQGGTSASPYTEWQTVTTLASYTIDQTRAQVTTTIFQALLGNRTFETPSLTLSTATPLEGMVDPRATPFIDSALLSLTYNCLALSLTTTPTLDLAKIFNVHLIQGANLETTPVIEIAALSQTHTLETTDYTTTVSLEIPSLRQAHNLTTDLVVTVPRLTLTELSAYNFLAALSLNTTPVFEVPLFSEQHKLLTSSLTATPNLELAAFAQHYTLTTLSLVAEVLVAPPLIIQAHSFTSFSVSVTPVLPQTTSTVFYVLSATGLETTPSLEPPLLSEHTSLAPLSTAVTPELERGVLDVHRNLSAVSVETTPLLALTAFYELHGFSVLGVTTQPILDRAGANEAHRLCTRNITVPLNAIPPTLTQRQELLALSLVVTSESTSARVTETHKLVSRLLGVTPAVGLARIAVGGILFAEETTVPITIEQTVFEQVHNLLAYRFLSPCTIGSPAFYQAGNNITSIYTEFETPVELVTQSQRSVIITAREGQYVI